MIPAESQSSARLDLPYLQAGQMQKHVTLNEALTRLDALVQCAVVSRSVAAQPAAPDDGALYIVPKGATGAVWSAMAPGGLARFEAGGWTVIAPPPGLRAFVVDEQRLLVLGDDGWTDVGAAPDRLDNLQGLGVGTASDETNAFAARLDSALWTARSEGEGGTGDLRYVLNKEGGAKVLSLLFQSGWSGRAEIGLVGDDDLVLKMSPDGEAWREALRVDRQTGRLAFPVMDALLRPATQEVLTTFETPPARARTFRIDDLISALEAAGVWARLGALYLTAGHDEQAARINLKAPGSNGLVPMNGSTFVTKTGYVGNGASAWLDTGLSAAAAADGGPWLAAGVWLAANPSPGSGQFLLGPVAGAETLSLALNPSTGGFSARVGTTTLANFGAAPTARGHFAVSRTDASHVTGFHNGLPLSTQVSAFTGYGDGHTGLLRRFNSYHAGTVAAAWLGQGLEPHQMSALHDALASCLNGAG
ncbi:MAG: DUF2793 domain-containing protein [Brevundimonas sp.]|uniref:DUF2793 domain-containing protein n=1 Tax=Brevundimonas sp. TaxID=1871086 RepID=UPI00391D7CCD